jgi:bifunctional non-homologous end joining protein LigD
MAQRQQAPRRLTEYKAKRNFSKTPEPSGDAKATAAAAKAAPKARQQKERFFCVQKHLASHLHYDFRLEHDGVLLSWAVPKGPSLNTKDKRLAMKVEDHPFDYGEFEGVIPEGYGAGIVLLWDKGTWTPEPGFEDVDKALAKGELKFRLNGVKLKGGWVLVRTGGRGNGDSRAWLLIKHRDEWAGEVDVAQQFPLSVKSFGDFEDVLAQDKPDVWESHRPARGGEAGEMLSAIIERAAKIKARAPEKRQAKPQPTPSAKPRAKGGAKKAAAATPRRTAGRRRASAPPRPTASARSTATKGAARRTGRA